MLRLSFHTAINHMKGTSMELTREEEMQAYMDALGAIVTAMAFQLDPIRLHADLSALAHVADKAGHGPSAGLIDELVRVIEVRALEKKGH
jgi:hypothetical protein